VERERAEEGLPRLVGFQAAAAARVVLRQDTGKAQRPVMTHPALREPRPLVSHRMVVDLRYDERVATRRDVVRLSKVSAPRGDRGATATAGREPRRTRGPRPLPSRDRVAPRHSPSSRPRGRGRPRRRTHPACNRGFYSFPAAERPESSPGFRRSKATFWGIFAPGNGAARLPESAPMAPRRRRTGGSWAGCPDRRRTRRAGPR
jgi:hypothetical protein